MKFLNAYQQARILLLSASIACFCIFWWTGVLLRVPVHPGHEVSLLQQPWPVAAVLIVVVVFLVCTALGTGIVGLVRYDAGLVAASVGLSALSLRGGSVQQSIFWSLSQEKGGSLFPSLAAETAVLAVVVGGCAWILSRLYRGGVIRDRESDMALDFEPTVGGEAATLLVQTILTGAGILILGASCSKQQAIAAVAIGSFAGAALTESMLPIASRTWCWLPPMLVGMVGYVAMWSDPRGLAIGGMKSNLAGLAYALPLDYASGGPAGALIGYWMGRRWARQRAEVLRGASEASGA